MRLDDVRVLDLSRLLPGPYATQLLCDLGADVIKIEDVDAGDYARLTPPYTDRDVGAIFDVTNRGKRSVAIDLKQQAGRDAFYRLVADADVVFESFSPGVVDRLEIDFETLQEHNEDLIYCSLTGYGQTGPLADRPGHDINYVGYAGLVDMTRQDPTDRPAVAGYQIGDLAGGLCAAFTIVAGLLDRELGTGGGEYIDVSMTDVVAALSQAVSYQSLTGDDPRPGGHPLTGSVPWYAIYECGDGRYVTLGALEPKFWERFCDAVDRPDLIEEHGVEDPARRQALREELASLFGDRDREEWLSHETTAGMLGPVNTPAEALATDQIGSRIVERPAEAPPRVGFPARHEDRDAVTDEGVPGQGEHTDALLREAGLEPAEIDELRAKNVIR